MINLVLFILVLFITLLLILSIIAVSQIKQTLLMIEFKYIHEKYFNFQESVHEWGKSIYKERLKQMEKSNKWVFENHEGRQEYYKKEVIDKIKEIVQETINKRPHSDNQIFENILEVIEEADGNANT